MILDRYYLQKRSLFQKKKMYFKKSTKPYISIHISSSRLLRQHKFVLSILTWYNYHTSLIGDSVKTKQQIYSCG